MTGLNAGGLANIVAHLLDRDLTFSLNFYRHPASLRPAELELEQDALLCGLQSAFGVLADRPPRHSLLFGLADRGRPDRTAPPRCGVGSNYLVIGSDRQVYQCHMETGQPVSDIDAADPLAGVQSNRSSVLNLPVEDKDCRDCAWRYRCAGGCPGRPCEAAAVHHAGRLAAVRSLLHNPAPGSRPGGPATHGVRHAATFGFVPCSNAVSLRGVDAHAIACAEKRIGSHSSSGCATSPPLRSRDGRDAWLMHLPHSVQRLIVKRNDNCEIDLAHIIGQVQGIELGDGQLALLILLDPLITETEGLSSGTTLLRLRRPVEADLRQTSPLAAAPGRIHRPPSGKELIIGRDEKVSIGWLEEGLQAANAVARLQVPSTIGGAVNGTGWRLPLRCC